MPEASALAECGDQARRRRPACLNGVSQHPDALIERRPSRRYSEHGVLEPLAGWAQSQVAVLLEPDQLLMQMPGCLRTLLDRQPQPRPGLQRDLVAANSVGVQR